MKLFNVDEKFAKLGFKKIEETDYIVVYTRDNLVNGEVAYTQILELGHRQNGIHLIHSYRKGVNCEGFNNMAGLSMREAVLSVQKMKKKGWKVL